MSIIHKYNQIDTTLKCALEFPTEFQLQSVKLNVKIDTGADLTLFPANILGIFDEDDFVEKIKNSNNIFVLDDDKTNKLKNKAIYVDVAGIKKGIPAIRFYALQVTNFIFYDTINDSMLEIGSVPIFISFDKSFRSPLFGRDLISLLNINIDNDINTLTIIRSNKYNTYFNAMGGVTFQYLRNNGYYKYSSMLFSEIFNMDVF